MELKQLLTSLLEKNLIYFSPYTQEYELTERFKIEYAPKSLGFEDVVIKQKKNCCSSRLDVQIKSEVIRGIYIDVPLIAANMSSVINADFCIDIQKYGALGILHRALPLDLYLNEVRKVAESCLFVPVSIGVGSDQLELAHKLIQSGANIITIDVAHGYSPHVVNLAKKLKKQYPDIKLVVGNTTNVEMLYEINDFADALKVGIASGLACKTKNTAGCFERQFSAVISFKEKARELGMPIISDGGVREPADFVKAIGAGASSVMAGSIFARCPNSAARTVNIDGEYKKVYFGMASTQAQVEWKGGLKRGTCSEGKTLYLPLGQPVDKLIEQYAGALRSGVTYAGGIDLKSYQDNVNFIKI